MQTLFKKNNQLEFDYKFKIPCGVKSYLVINVLKCLILIQKEHF